MGMGWGKKLIFFVVIMQGYVRMMVHFTKVCQCSKFCIRLRLHLSMKEVAILLGLSSNWRLTQKKYRTENSKLPSIWKHACLLPGLDKLLKKKNTFYFTLKTLSEAKKREHSTLPWRHWATEYLPRQPLWSSAAVIVQEGQWKQAEFLAWLGHLSLLVARQLSLGKPSSIHAQSNYALISYWILLYWHPYCSTVKHEAIFITLCIVPYTTVVAHCKTFARSILPPPPSCTHRTPHTSN